MKMPTNLRGTITAGTGGADSLFVMCSSYEPRTLAVVSRLETAYKCERAVICRASEYADKGDAPQHHAEAMRRLLCHCQSQPQSVDFSLAAPVKFWQDFGRKVGPFGKPQDVTIDITTFPRQELIMLLKFFDQGPHRGRLRLLYAEPAKYATESETKDHRWLTRGVVAVHSVPGFSGIQYPQLAKLLVIVLGHEGERTFITLRRHQPDKVILLTQGGEQYRPELADISSTENKNLIEQFGQEAVWRRELPAHGVEETQEELEQIVQLFRMRYNVFVASNGTKLQLIGTYLAVRNFLEVQVTYACPALYNWEHYSKGWGKVWEMTVPSSECLVRAVA